MTDGARSVSAMVARNRRKVEEAMRGELCGLCSKPLDDEWRTWVTWDGPNPYEQLCVHLTCAVEAGASPERLARERHLRTYFEHLREQGLCGRLNRDLSRICIRDIGHEQPCFPMPYDQEGEHG